jgi:hypothetical protein
MFELLKTFYFGVFSILCTLLLCLMYYRLLAWNIFVWIVFDNSFGSLQIQDLPGSSGIMQVSSMLPASSCNWDISRSYQFLNPKLLSFRQWAGTRDWSMLLPLKVAISSAFSIMQELSILLWELSGMITMRLILFEVTKV